MTQDEILSDLNHIITTLTGSRTGTQARLQLLADRIAGKDITPVPDQPRIMAPSPASPSGIEYANYSQMAKELRLEVAPNTPLPKLKAMVKMAQEFNVVSLAERSQTD